MKSLLCVFNGEFGWEIAQWQGFCRKQSRNFNKTYVVTSNPDSAYLYSDFADIITDITQIPRTNKVITWQKDKIISDDKQEFKKFEGESRGGGFFDGVEYPFILIHARNTNITFKNYPEEEWENLVGLIKDKYKINVVSVGSGAIHIPGTYDYREVHLNTLCWFMKNALMVIGPSSGPIHLAQHCEAPVLVWGDDKIYQGRNTIRQRIENTWNPFNSLSVVIDKFGWNPPVNTIMERIELSQQFSGCIKQEKPIVEEIKEVEVKEKLSKTDQTYFEITQKMKDSEISTELATRLWEVIEKGTGFVTVTKFDEEKKELQCYFEKGADFPEEDVFIALNTLTKAAYQKYLKKTGEWK